MRRIVILVTAAILFAPGAAAIDLNSSHSLQYFSGTNLNFEVQTTGQVNAFNTLDLNGNDIDTPGSILSYYGSACPSGEAVQDVNDDGTFNCINIDAASSGTPDEWVNETGDNMSGRLGMQGNSIFRIGPGEINISDAGGDIQMNNNRVEGLASADSTDDAMPRGDILSEFVEEGGDTMSGNLDMNGNQLQNALQATFDNANDNDFIHVSGGGTTTPHTLRFDDRDLRIWSGDGAGTMMTFINDTGEIQINSGPFDLGGNTIQNPGSISSFFGSACGAGEAVQDVADGGGFSCVSVGDDAGVDYDALVNRSGGSASSMTGNFNVGGNRIQNLGSADSTDDAMPRGDILSEFVEEAGDTMSGNLDMSQNQLLGVGSMTLNGSLTLPNDKNSGRIYMDYSSNDLVIEGRDPEQHLELTDGGELIYREYTSTSNNVFEVSSTGSGNAEVHLGLAGSTVPLDLHGNTIQNPGSITSYFGSACSSGQAVQDIADGGGFTCVNVEDTPQDVWVNESGDTMTGDLDMGTNQLHSASFLHGTQGGIADSLSTAQNNVPSGNSFYVQDDLKVGGDIVGASGDVAEKVPTDDTLEPGEVAVIADDMSLSASSQRYSTAVAGIISTDPSYVLAAERDGQPLALSGIVPTKVVMENGNISPGDLLTTASTPGAAMRCADRTRCQGAVIGKAMEAATTNGKIKVLVTLG